MYEFFFNLTRKPFDLLPDPDFLYMSRSHKRALSYLDYGIRERAGFILLTGEVGSGKTTIIRNLIKKHLDNVVLSKIFNTKVDSEQLIAMINDDFGLPVMHKDKITLLRDLNTFLIEQFTRGNRPVLIIDEAQNLSPDLLEEIRLLSNLETDSAKLLQIILVGQPELRDTLASPSLIQLRQRISINCHIHPLTPAETEEYILHRLEKAGDRNAARFSRETMDVIFSYSRGIPRLINIICDFILLAAFAEETSTIDIALVRDVIGDLDFNHHFWGEARQEGAGGIVIPEYVAPRQPALPVKADAAGFPEPVGGDTPESGAGAFSQEMFLEMTAKISDLEQSLKSQQEKTGSIMQKLRKYIPMLGGW